MALLKIVGKEQVGKFIGGGHRIAIEIPASQIVPMDEGDERNQGEQTHDHPAQCLHGVPCYIPLRCAPMRCSRGSRSYRRARMISRFKNPVAFSSRASFAPFMS